MKGGDFAGSCFSSHKFGHLASDCPTMMHQPPPNVMPRDTTPTQPKEGKKSIIKPVEKIVKNVVQIGNKVSLHVGS